MKKSNVTRREFVRHTAWAAAGVTVGASGLVSGAAAEPPLDTAKILNYNPNMEYRRQGKTGLQIAYPAFEITGPLQHRREYK